MNRPRLGLAAIALCAGTASSALAGDVTWDNGSSNGLWDTTSLNWGGAAWNNGNGDGAIFDATGAGAIDIMGPIALNSLNFTADGYVLSGTGSLNIVAGTSTQTTGVVNVAAGATAKINVGVNSSLGFQKIGAGTLELSAPSNFTGPGIPLTSNGLLRADLIVGGVAAGGSIASGTLRLMNSAVLPASTRASIANGFLDIGNNTVTLSDLTFVNATVSQPYDPILRAAGNGVIGNGTLRVTGEINVLGVTGGNQGSNSIGANLDLGGGTQIIRSGLISSIGLSSALQITGSISNGSLLKTVGVGTGGIPGSIDGIGLFGNNTYTGATIINSGTNVVTGTNASTSVKIAGIPAGPSGGQLILQGQDGSYLSATSVDAVAGGTFVIDNNAALGANGNRQPNIPSFQNNNRLRDDAALTLRDGNFTYRGRTGEAASETIGSMTNAGGHTVVTLTPNGGGTAAVNVAGNLSLAPRATMQVSSTTLGAASKLVVGGTVPAADSTGIITRMVGSADFLTYDAVNGFQPFTGYAPDFSTPGANVAATAASTIASSTAINSLKRTGAFTTTIGADQTLTITSGMILNTSGTGVITGGTLDFGSNPGVLFSGTTNISSAITGTQGLINANATSTISGDLSGLSGTMSIYNGTTTISTNTFAGPIEIRAGQLNIGTSQTLVGAGAITMGVSANDANLVGLIPTLSFSAAGANAVMNRDIIVDNGAQNAAGAEFGFSFVSRLSPLSNATGSQTLSGNVVLNSPVNLQGGGGGGTGSTNFTGDISGPALFILPNGRASFSGNVRNTDGFLIGGTGFTAQVTFDGTTSGNAPIRLNSGNNTFVAYKNGSLPTGLFTFRNATTAAVPSLIALENSTINNEIFFSGSGFGSAGAGVTAVWGGKITGAGIFAKSGAGTLVLTSNTSTYSGPVQVQAGEFRVNGTLPASSATVSAGAMLSGTGVFGGSVVAAAGAVIAPGASIGTLRTGSMSLSGTLSSEVDLNNGGFGTADLLDVIGSVGLSGATLDLQLLNAPAIGSWGIGTYIILANDGADAVSGAFASISGLASGYSATVDYAYSGTDSIGRVGDGNDIAVVIVPTPGTAALFVASVIVPFARRRRR